MTFGNKQKEALRKRLNKKEPKKELTEEQAIKKEVSRLRSEVRKLRKEVKELREYLYEANYRDYR